MLLENKCYIYGENYLKFMSPSMPKLTPTFP